MNQLNLFSSPGEKGSNEWSTFRGIREENSGMFRVREPQQPRRVVTTIERPARPQSLFFKQRPQH